MRCEHGREQESHSPGTSAQYGAQTFITFSEPGVDANASASDLLAGPPRIPSRPPRTRQRAAGVVSVVPGQQIAGERHSQHHGVLVHGEVEGCYDTTSSIGNGCSVHVQLQTVADEDT